MAEVENMSATTNIVATPTPAASSDALIENNNNGEPSGAEKQLGISPSQQQSQSHPHDSEYDTASDLEGEGGYDDDDDDDEDEDTVTDDEDVDSLSDDENDGDGDEDDEDDDDQEDQDKSLLNASKEKAESAQQKKADEDRSNPQYIPKRGTFYEHDDRTAEGEEEPSVASENDDTSKNNQVPNVANTSKVTKKWQTAGKGDTWSHDRFDASEQAPKSRAELVSAYGYDIRIEDAPPRSRRRRQYAHGPNRYSRNWEDANAYLKISNKDRKPSRSSDFPALNERKTQKASRSRKEEKENRADKRSVGRNRNNSLSDKNNQAVHPTQNDERESKRDSNRERKNRSDRGDGGDHGDRENAKSSRTKNYARQMPFPGRQTGLEFKQKRHAGPQQTVTSNNNSQTHRIDTQIERHSHRSHNAQTNPSEVQKHYTKGGQQKHQNAHSQQQGNESYSNGTKVVSEQTYQHSQQQHQQQQQVVRTAIPMKPTSNLAQRLQIQNRNDPSHVGSIQMHSLVTQNQLAEQEQSTTPNHLVTVQQPQQVHEQRGPPKRYSSLRRSQHETQHLAEQHIQQQLHMQQQQQQAQQQQQPPPPPIILQDQHMIQTNLMQLYHQENVKAQMQALQVGTGAGKQVGYGPVPTAGQSQAQGYGGSHSAAAGPAAYYVTGPDAYATTATGNATTPQTGQYSQQPANFITSGQSATAAPLSYTAAPQSAQSGIAGAATTPYCPTPTVAVVPVSVATTQPNANPNQNFTNYQNYNTVGGTTYFVPPTPTNTRSIVLPTRRPTNAIPILPPSEKNKRGIDTKEEDSKNNVIASITQSNAPIGSAENIDHIIDNMFVQRPAYQPPQPPQASNINSTSPSILSGEKTSAVAGNANTVINEEMQEDETCSSKAVSPVAGSIAAAGSAMEKLNIDTAQSAPIEAASTADNSAVVKND